jgi:hypothetical protein
MFGHASFLAFCCEKEGFLHATCPWPGPSRLAIGKFEGLTDFINKTA